MPELRQRVDRWSEYLREDLNSDEIEQVINVLVKMVEKVERNRNGDLK